MGEITHEDVLRYFATCVNVEEMEKLYFTAEDRLEELGYFEAVDEEEFASLEEDWPDEEDDFDDEDEEQI